MCRPFALLSITDIVMLTCLKYNWWYIQSRIKWYVCYLSCWIYIVLFIVVKRDESWNIVFYLLNTLNSIILVKYYISVLHPLHWEMRSTRRGNLLWCLSTLTIILTFQFSWQKAGTPVRVCVRDHHGIEGKKVHSRHYLQVKIKAFLGELEGDHSLGNM